MSFLFVDISVNSKCLFAQQTSTGLIYLHTAKLITANFLTKH